MEQPGGSLGYENQQTRSVMPRSFPPSRSSVRLYWHFHRAVRFGAARFTYIGVSTRWAYLLFDTPPLGYQAVWKGVENMELHTPLFRNQLKNIPCDMTMPLMSLQHKQRGGFTLSINEVPNCNWLNTMINILKGVLLWDQIRAIKILYLWKGFVPVKRFCTWKKGFVHV